MKFLVAILFKKAKIKRKFIYFRKSLKVQNCQEPSLESQSLGDSKL